MNAGKNPGHLTSLVGSDGSTHGLKWMKQGAFRLVKHVSSKPRAAWNPKQPIFLVKSIRKMAHFRAGDSFPC